MKSGRRKDSRQMSSRGSDSTPESLKSAAELSSVESFLEDLGLLPRFLLQALSKLPDGCSLEACAVEVYCETVRCSDNQKP